MSKEIEKLVFDATNEIVAKNGYELARVEYSKIGADYELALYIFKPEGISLDDCEKVHHLVVPILDELNPTNDAPYSLTISSLGLEAPLKTTRDFERRLNSEIEVKLYSPNEEGQKVFCGNLIKVDEEYVYIMEKGIEKSILRKNIANAHLKIEL